MESVRKIRRGHRGNRGRISAAKAGGRAEFESTLERDFYLLLDFDTSVARFVTQPVKLHYTGVGGRKKPYVPDTLVFYTGERPPCLFEVKHVEELQKDPAEYRLKFQAARRYAREQGWHFCTATEKSIRGTQLHNVNFLRPYLDPDRTYPAEDLDFVLAQVQQPTTPGAILNHLPLQRKATLLSALWHLVATRQIQIALDTRVSMDSPIWRAP